MPIISMFYGIIVRMFHFDTARHKAPHIHVQYGEQSAVIAIPSGNMLDGKLKPTKLKLVQAWIEIHRDELMADWQRLQSGSLPFPIAPLE